MNMIKRVTRSVFSKSDVTENREKYLAMSSEEKRKLYKCKENFISLNKIKTWTEYSQENQIKEKQSKTVINLIVLFYYDYMFYYFRFRSESNPEYSLQ